jgi:hypothetical protein
MTEPAQKPGRSKQDYGTDPRFLEAIGTQFGRIGIDLACRRDNMVAPLGITDPDLDALAQDWSDPYVWNSRDTVVETVTEVAVAFCNPPFANIEPWAAKLETCRWLRRWTLMLVPYSASSQWFVNHVMGKLMVYGIPRITFVGTTAPYPKDLCLIAAGYGANGQAFWDWRKAIGSVSQVEEATAAQ